MRVWLLVALLTAAAWADVAVTILTDPPGARIIPVRRGAVAGEAQPEAGRSNGLPVVLRIPPGQTSITLRLEHDLCQPKTITIDDLSALQSGKTDTWPPQGKIELQYRSAGHAALGFLRSWALLLAGAGASLGLVVGGVLWRARQAQRQAQKLEQRARTITDLVVPSAHEDLLLGRNLDGYLLVERLGQGGMATVYRAFPEDRLGQPEEAVAIKVLHSELAHDNDFVRRFDREKSVYGELIHPNIVRIYGYGSFQEHYYLVMELIHGTTLRACMPEGTKLPLSQALEYLRPILQALSYAHRKGIVHRDLKPENIMVTQAGKLKVMDFGMARSQQNETVTATGALLGTPTYMAPEQIQGNLDTRTDQYALGVMIYEMLAGRPPFVEDNPVTLLIRHLHDAPPPLSGQWAEIVARMLAKSPDERYADLDEALKALERAL